MSSTQPTHRVVSGNSLTLRSPSFESPLDVFFDERLVRQVEALSQEIFGGGVGQFAHAQVINDEQRYGRELSLVRQGVRHDLQSGASCGGLPGEDPARLPTDRGAKHGVGWRASACRHAAHRAQTLSVFERYQYRERG